jgi:hypothetical protein
MTPEQVYACWAPDESVWSAWAKPVLFAQLEKIPAASEPIPDFLLPEPFAARGDAALVVDLPGEESVFAGLALARRGFRPVPLYNATHGGRPLLDVAAIGRWLEPGISVLRDASLPADAPPAFLLDSARRGEKLQAAPGAWDNRWIAFPQDFPSAALLQSRAVRSAVLVQRGAREPQVDLAHVLLAWQKAGLVVQSLDLAAPAPPAAIDVREPGLFRRAWYRAIALLGLRRGFVGGFGAQIPEPSSGRSGFYG